MTRSSRARLWVFATVLGLMSFKGLAQQGHPQAENGIVAARLYDQVGQDSINLFNGNLMFTIPIGEAIPVGPQLTISPALSFNAMNLKNWTIRFAGPDNQCPYSSGVRQTADGDRMFGSGWQLHFGRVVSNPGRWDTSLCAPVSLPTTSDPPYSGPYPAIRMGDTYLAYQSPDGGVHAFYDRQFETTCDMTESACRAANPAPPDCLDPARANSTTQCFYYTHDGSYLRLDPRDPSHGRMPTVYFPDGTIAEMQLKQGRHPGSDNDAVVRGEFEYAWYSDSVWNTTRLLDRFGNSIDVLYYGMSGNGADGLAIPDHPLKVPLPSRMNQWEAIPYQVYPTSDPSRHVQFTAEVISVQKTFVISGTPVTRTYYAPQITSISVPTSERSGSGFARGTYFLSYAPLPSADQFLYPRLAGVQQPDGLSYSLTYPASGLDISLLSVTLPSGGRYEYEYGAPGFSALARREDCEAPQPEPCTGYDAVEPSGSSVWKRRLIRNVRTPGSAEVPEVSETVYYRSYPAGTCSIADDSACYLRVDTFQPLAPGEGRRASRSIFWPSDWIKYSKVYGRPTSTSEYLLGEQLTPSALVLDSATPLSRTTYVYDGDGHNEPPSSLDTSKGFSHNTRVAVETTRWCNDASCGTGRFSEAVRTGWDNYGHFGRTESREYDGTTTRVLRVVDETYLNSTPTTACPTCWMLGFPTSRTISRPSETGLDPSGTNLSTTETFEYDATGFRTAHQIVGGEPEGNRTLRHEYTKGTQTLGPCLATAFVSASCSNLGFPATQIDKLTGSWGGYPVNSTYTRWFYYRYGALTAARDNVGFYSVDLDLAPTGKAVGARGSDGRTSLSDSAPQLTTVMNYDRLGRVVSIAPPGEGPEDVTYGPQSVVRVKRDSAGAEVSRREAYFDQLGRLTGERVRMPGGTWACRLTTYDIAGRRVGQTEWWKSGEPGIDTLCDSVLNLQASIGAAPFPVSSPPGTTWAGFDGLGRPSQTRFADGSRVTDTYTGWWQQETTRTVNSATESKTLVERDVLGQVVAVTEPAATKADGLSLMNPAERTTYRYDHAGHLILIKKPGSNSSGGAAVTQTRSRRYDDFGWLLRQSDPEQSSFTVSSRDARGNPLKSLDGTATISRTFDPAGRLLTAAKNGESTSWDNNGVPSTAYEVNRYDSISGFNMGRSNGKLVLGFRANHALTNEGTVDFGWYGVTDMFHYNGLGGRLSFRQHGDNWFGFTAASPPSQIQTLPGASKGSPAKLALERYFESRGRKDKTAGDALRRMASSESAAVTRMLADPANATGMARWQYQYDSAGRLSRLIYPRRDEGFPTEATYSYDAGFLTGVTAAIRDPFAATTVETVTGSLSYSPAGSVASTTISSNGGATRVFSLSTPRHVSGLSRLSSWNLTATSAGTSIESRNFSYDPSGNIASITSSTGTNPVLTTTDSFIYDARGRLTSDTLPVRPGSNDTETREYDGFGNLTRVANGPYISTFNVSRQTNQLSASGILWDGSGNLLYDPINGRNVARDYYPDGALAAENVHPPNATSGTPPAISSWLVDSRGDNALTFYGDGVNCDTEYFLGSLRNETGAVLTDYKADVAAPCDCGGNVCSWIDKFQKDYIRIGPWALVTYKRNEGTAFWALDHLGTPRTRFNKFGSFVSSIRLDSFGQEISTSAGERHRFTGHERQHVSGLDGAQFPISDFMHARTYVPMLGRFTRPDPADSFSVFDPQSLNRYTYARNNPVNLVDSTGLSVELAGCAARNDDQCRAEFAVVKESVGEGAAAHLSVDDKGMVQIVGATTKEFAVFGNQAAVMGALIGSADTYRFDGAPVTGGLSAQYENEYNPSNRTIFLDLSNFPRILGNVSVSAAEAFVHESAHALWQAVPGIGAAIGAKTNPGWSLLGPAWPGANEGFATALENQWRRDVGLRSLRQFYSHQGDYVDPGRRLRVVYP